MNNILRNYIQCLNEITSKSEIIIQKYKLIDHLNIDERKELFQLIINFEKLKLWAKNVLYNEDNRPYEEDIDSNIEISNIKEILINQLGLLEINNIDNEQVSIMSRKQLPKICPLTREIFKNPVSQRYQSSEKIKNLCKNHVFEKQALIEYLGNQNKKICPIAGCSLFIIRKYLKVDQEVLDYIKNNDMIKTEEYDNFQSLLD